MTLRRSELNWTGEFHYILPIACGLCVLLLFLVYLFIFNVSCQPVTS